MQKQKYVTKESKVHSYIQIPATLLKENLGSTTLLIYGVLLTRVTLSQKNCWTDELGRVFIIYPISKIAEHIGKGESVVKSCLKKLEMAGLLLRKRSGFNKPNHLFVLVPEDSMGGQKQSVKKMENDTTEVQKSDYERGEKPASNYYNITNHRTTKYSYEDGESL